MKAEGEAMTPEGCYQHSYPQSWCELCRIYAEIDNRHLWSYPDANGVQWCVHCGASFRRGGMVITRRRCDGRVTR